MGDIYTMFLLGYQTFSCKYITCYVLGEQYFLRESTSMCLCPLMEPFYSDMPIISGPSLYMYVNEIIIGAIRYFFIVKEKGILAYSYVAENDSCKKIFCQGDYGKLPSHAGIAAVLHRYE